MSEPVVKSVGYVREEELAQRQIRRWWRALPWYHRLWLRAWVRFRLWRDRT